MKFYKYYLLVACTFFIFSSCDKKEAKKTTPKQSDLYYKANIDGKDVLFEQDKNGYGSGAGASSGQKGTNDTNVQEQSTMLINPAMNSSSGIVVYKNFTGTVKCPEIESMFHLGSYPYCPPMTAPNVPTRAGVAVFYTDPAGKYWVSSLGTGDQTGSTFEITEHMENNDGWSKRISKIKFSCNLYDGQGGKLVLKNGEMKTRTVQCGHL